jgi:hypothetical protein
MLIKCWIDGTLGASLKLRPTFPYCLVESLGAQICILTI